MHHFYPDIFSGVDPALVCARVPSVEESVQLLLLRNGFTNTIFNTVNARLAGGT